MKQIKVILLVIYTAAYTSLIWANAVFNWIRIDDFYFGLFLFIILTLANLAIFAVYCIRNWDKP